MYRNVRKYAECDLSQSNLFYLYVLLTNNFLIFYWLLTTNRIRHCFTLVIETITKLSDILYSRIRFSFSDQSLTTKRVYITSRRRCRCYFQKSFLFSWHKHNKTSNKMPPKTPSKGSKMIAKPTKTSASKSGASVEKKSNKRKRKSNEKFYRLNNFLTLFDHFFFSFF